MIDASTADTVPALLALQAGIRGGAPALIAVERGDVSYATLHRDVERFGALFGEVGLGRQSRIALVTPGGTETAVATLAAMSYALCAPLDPSLEACCSLRCAWTRCSLLRA